VCSSSHSTVVARSGPSILARRSAREPIPGSHMSRRCSSETSRCTSHAPSCRPAPSTICVPHPASSAAHPRRRLEGRGGQVATEQGRADSGGGKQAHLADVAHGGSSRVRHSIRPSSSRSLPSRAIRRGVERYLAALVCGRLVVARAARTHQHRRKARAPHGSLYQLGFWPTMDAIPPRRIVLVVVDHLPAKHRVKACTGARTAEALRAARNPWNANAIPA
jgi:hypothetical protein